MKFICTRENLSHSLALTIGVAGKNINLPILSNVLIKVQEQKVELVATNLELAIVANLRAKVEEPGQFTVPARTLNDFVNLLSDEKVELTVIDNELEVACGKSTTKIKGAPADEFPVVPSVSEGKGYLLDARDLHKALSQVAHAVAKNEIRPELAGVFFGYNVESKTLTLAATDSFRLAEKKISIQQGEEQTKAVVPPRAAQEIIHIISLSRNPEGDKNARVLMSDNQIVLRTDDVELVSRLVDGQYPDYTQIIPKEFKTTAEFSTDLMAKEVKAASLFTTTGVNAVSFELSPEASAVTVSSTSTQTGEHTSQVSAEIHGEKNSILLNHRYVLDALANIDCGSACLKVINLDSPCLFAPKEDQGYTYIVMPIRQ